MKKILEQFADRKINNKNKPVRRIVKTARHTRATKCRGWQQKKYTGAAQVYDTEIKRWSRPRAIRKTQKTLNFMRQLIWRRRMLDATRGEWQIWHFCTHTSRGIESRNPLCCVYAFQVMTKSGHTCSLTLSNVFRMPCLSKSEITTLWW